MNPRSSLNRRVELAANCVIVVACLVIGYNFIRSHFSPATRAVSTIKAGSRLNLPAVDWASQEKTLVLALRQGCHFCAESAPFYQRLARAAANSPKVHLMAVLPGDVPADASYLNGLGVKIQDIRQADLGWLQLPYTPTLAVIDRDGVVRDVWVGKLSDSREKQVMKRLGLADVQ